MRRFSQVDVFTSVACRGNPLAVVVDGDGLSDTEMARFANWTNLSETTFLMKPTNPAADYWVRIFTTTHELPFAGHPTIGSCHAWLQAGGRAKGGDRIVQQCGVGLVELRQTSGRLGFAAPSLLRSGSPDEQEIDKTCRVLGIERSEIVDIEWIDNGPGWLGVLLDSAERVLSIEPNMAGEDFVHIGIAGPHPAGSSIDLEVRAFYKSGDAGCEDPVTGSLNASLAQWLIGKGIMPPSYSAGQGQRLGRAGLIYLSSADDQIWVSGDAVTVINGEVRI